MSNQQSSLFKMLEIYTYSIEYKDKNTSFQVGE